MGAHEQGANATDGRWVVIPRTLCFVINDDAMLLMKRAPHKRVFPNRYNGVGGHIERDEDPLTGAKREILEETGLKVQQIDLRAVYNIDTGETTGILLFVFIAVSDSRDVTAHSTEGSLHWVAQDKVLEQDLVEDIPVILPRVLAMRSGDTPLYVHVSYNASDEIQMRFANE